MTSRPSFGKVSLCRLKDGNDSINLTKECSNLNLFLSADNAFVELKKTDNGEIYKSFSIIGYKGLPVTQRLFAFHPLNESAGEESMALCFEKPEYLREFELAFRLAQFIKPKNLKELDLSNGDSKHKKSSEFDQRTEESSASQYFQFYGYLFQQQNMMQDYVRTSTYQRAIHSNLKDFKDKVVMDVGAGSGILSFFAIQAGARKVYAVEASTMAVHCAEIVRTNGLSDRIIVVPGKVEEISIPEPVDILISEPMGYMLVNERMLESYMHARKFLKPGGKMFPTISDLHLALFMDDALYIEQNQKASFWSQEHFHGINLSALRQQSFIEIFKQPIVDTWHVGILASPSVRWSINFEKDPVEKLHKINIPFEVSATKTGYIHGIATWFDVGFLGSEQTIWLSTAPTEPLTHWYQVRCLLQKPVFVQAGQSVFGCLLMVANDKQSYDVEIEIEVGNQKATNSLDLKNPLFRYTGQMVMPPPGSYQESPSDQLIQYVETHENAVEMDNGIPIVQNVPVQAIQVQQNPPTISYIPLPTGPYVPSNQNVLAGGNPTSSAQTTLITQQIGGANFLPTSMGAAQTLVNGYPLTLSPQQNVTYVNGRPQR